MKLSEFLEHLFKITGPTCNTMEDYMLTSEILNIPHIKEGLLKCEEFKDTKELIIIDSPSMEIDIEGKTKAVHSSTMKIAEGLKFKEKVYLHSIWLTPETYDTKDLTTPVKDGILISPVVYNQDLVPQRSISIFFNPERMQDELMLGDEKIKEELIEKFKKALENTKEYLVKGKRGILIRGILEESIVIDDIPSEYKKGQYVTL